MSTRRFSRLNIWELSQVENWWKWGESNFQVACRKLSSCGSLEWGYLGNRLLRNNVFEMLVSELFYCWTTVLASWFALRTTMCFRASGSGFESNANVCMATCLCRIFVCCTYLWEKPPLILLSGTSYTTQSRWLRFWYLVFWSIWPHSLPDVSIYSDQIRYLQVLIMTVFPQVIFLFIL